jgi:hypothetical protein
MSTIRPDLTLSPLPATPVAAPLRAAQAAFFRAAPGEVTAAPVAPSPQGVREEEPAVARRPGALLDIRV